ncbi:hypothetical protein GmHk_18G051769 [Glycine max]|nr:hypothetical protein GmHk_18G051769 [Glycine max]
MLMKEKLRNVWKLQRGFDLIDVLHVYFMVRFDVEADKEKIHFHGLGLVYYDPSVLLTLASVVGTPIRVYTNTVNMDGGRFACVYVEIDLSVPVVGKFFLNGAWYHVEYE